MLKWFEIICFINNSNPHGFLFLSGQLGHILEKEDEKQFDDMTLRMDYVLYTKYVREKENGSSCIVVLSVIRICPPIGV